MLAWAPHHYLAAPEHELEALQAHAQLLPSGPEAPTAAAASAAAATEQPPAQAAAAGLQRPAAHASRCCPLNATLLPGGTRSSCYYVLLVNPNSDLSLRHLYAAALEHKLEALQATALQLLNQSLPQHQLLPNPLQQRSSLLLGQQRLARIALPQPGCQTLQRWLAPALQLLLCRPGCSCCGPGPGPLGLGRR